MVGGARQSQVVELRFFADLSIEQTTHVLGSSTATDRLGRLRRGRPKTVNPRLLT